MLHKDTDIWNSIIPYRKHRIHDNIKHLVLGCIFVFTIGVDVEAVKLPWSESVQHMIWYGVDDGCLIIELGSNDSYGIRIAR